MGQDQMKKVGNGVHVSVLFIVVLLFIITICIYYLFFLLFIYFILCILFISASSKAFLAFLAHPPRPPKACMGDPFHPSRVFHPQSTLESNSSVWELVGHGMH